MHTFCFGVSFHLSAWNLHASTGFSVILTCKNCCGCRYSLIQRSISVIPKTSKVFQCIGFDKMIRMFSKHFKILSIFIFTRGWSAHAPSRCANFNWSSVKPNKMDFYICSMLVLKVDVLKFESWGTWRWKVKEDIEDKYQCSLLNYCCILFRFSKRK